MISSFEFTDIIIIGCFCRHHTILCEPEGACTSTLQSNVRTQSYTCTAEPDDVRDDLHSELCIDCEPELSSTGQGVLNEHTCMSLVTPSHSLMDSQNYTVQDEISSLSATQHSFQRHQQSISPSGKNNVLTLAM